MQPNIMQTFNAHEINDGYNYKATLLNAGLLPDAANVYLTQTNDDAIDSGAYTVAVRNPLVNIEIIDYANRFALGEQLKRWFKPGTRGPLVTYFTDDELDYQLNCAVINIVQNPDYPTHFMAQLQSPDTAWRAVAADTDDWTVTGTGGTFEITVAGSDETRLITQMTPSSVPVDGYSYQLLYQLIDKPKKNYGKRAWCLVMDTDALVGAGKLQADCNDLRVVVDGQEVKRWIADPNTTTTKIWFNLLLSPGFELSLKTALADSGEVSFIQFKPIAANQDAINAMPAEGIIVHGTEWIAYTGKNVANCRLKLPQRAIFGTTEQAHATGDIFKFMQHTIVIKYGNASATDPAGDDPLYDNEKPPFDLSASDNEFHVYTDATKFYDPLLADDAPGYWAPVLKVMKTGTVSKYYSFTGDAESGDPALGAKMGSFLRSGIWQTDTGMVGFLLQCAGGITQVSMTGRKYRSTARWPALAGCLRSPNNADWFVVFDEATPSVVDTWEDFTHTDVSTPATTKFIFVGFSGTVTKLADAYAMLEGLTATIGFNTDNLPTGTLFSELDNYTLNLELFNQVNDDRILLNYPMRLSKAFLIDSENSQVTYDGNPMFDALRLNNEGRSGYIRLQPGVNTLELVSEDVGELMLALSWYRRRL